MWKKLHGGATRFFRTKDMVGVPPTIRKFANSFPHQEKYPPPNFYPPTSRVQSMFKSTFTQMELSKIFDLLKTIY